MVEFPCMSFLILDTRAFRGGESNEIDCLRPCHHGIAFLSSSFTLY